MDAPSERPTEYGRWWNTNELGLEWYQTIYRYRSKIHEYFVDWFKRNAEQEQWRSVLEVGCGRAYPYAEIFSSYEYTGIDISSKEIDWCRQRYPQHRFWCGDFLADQFSERSDCAFAHAVIDHVYDINLFLRRMVTVARRSVFITAYRGWFEELQQHRYEWNESVTCFHNEISPAETRKVLSSLGCRRVEIFALKCDNPFDKIEHETAVIAYL